uniref:Uncharacterized protein n=1 Tax=Stomoxys calcitrans TaxID=35570 RepID=A0A1I8PWR8_STOCA
MPYIMMIGKIQKFSRKMENAHATPVKTFLREIASSIIPLIMFSMLESGEYPSFMELFGLQERGIDYELIYDRILVNKSAILNIQENVPEPISKLPFFLLTNNPFRSDIVLELTTKPS